MEKEKKVVKITPLENKTIKSSEISAENKLEKSVEKANRKEFYWILGVMIFVILIIILIPIVARQMDKFNYQGLTFTKERFGQIPVYHYYYYVGPTGSSIHLFNIYLRIDPRKNNSTVQGNIAYPDLGSVVYVSLNSTAFDNLKCQNVLREMSTIATFINGNNYFAKAGNPDSTFATKNNITYATCQSKPSNMVLLITPGGETKITRSTSLCYTITVKDCDLLSAVEKFEVQSIVDSKNGTFF